ncbi:MAG: hypothetical protein ACFFD9_09405 [Candidatus Thorarchaeota archaeon]
MPEIYLRKLPKWEKDRTLSVSTPLLQNQEESVETGVAPSLREILKLDDRGRMLIPKPVREFLDLEKNLDELKKSTDTITIVAVLNADARLLRITSLVADNDSLTLLVHSNQYSESHKQDIRDISEALWGKTADFRAGALKKGDKLITLEINKSGRIHVPKAIREGLNLDFDSYLMSIGLDSDNDDRQIQLIPLMSPTKTLLVRILMKSGAVEWRTITPRPKDERGLRREISKEKEVKKVEFF